jgi:hypothetical protein
MAIAPRGSRSVAAYHTASCVHRFFFSVGALYCLTFESRCAVMSLLTHVFRNLTLLIYVPKFIHATPKFLLFPTGQSCFLQKSSLCNIVQLDRPGLLLLQPGGLGLKILVAKRQRGPTHNYKAII